MAFPPAFLDELNQRNPIEDVVGQYVALTRKGSNLFGLCPFHGEKTASFSVSPEKGIFYCFGCHKGGGAIHFIMEMENLSYPDAVRFLAKRVNLEVPEDEAYRSEYRKKERLWALCKDAARWFHAQLKSPLGRAGCEYAQKRGLSAAVLTRFGIGFAPDRWSALLEAMTAKGYTKQELLDVGLVLQNREKGTLYDRFRNRLMFPIIDTRGNVIGFGGRVMDDSTPKYLNSPETIIFNKRKNLFGLNLAKKTKFPYLVLTEGYMDTVTLHRYGFDCAVASLGTSLTQEHADLLSKYTDEVVLTYDGDEAGQNATRRAIPMLEKTGLRVRVLRMQGAKDPDEFLQKFGADRFRLLLEDAENQAQYRLNSLQMKFDLSADDQKVEFAKQAAELICMLSTPVEREIYSARAAQAAGLSEDVMRQEVARAYKRRSDRRRREQERRDLDIAAALRPADRTLHYDDLRSAVAEEGVLRMLLRCPELMARAQVLEAESFSVPMFGKCFQALKERAQQDLSISASALSEVLTPGEMAHLTAILQKDDALGGEAAFDDCVQTICEEYRNRTMTSDADALRKLQETLRKKKGMNGNG